MTTYEEWRVTGTLDGEAVDSIWSPPPSETANSVEPESDARTYIRVQTYASRMREGRVGWSEGPHLHKRTVTVWVEVEP
jgi:hypothetical protein